ncbi:hypothetical protein BD410DRAFT_852307 [Rickenella mellea]|uniref:NAD(P)-binding domain-containing protein n=1 Tax=Rickenella mellea TaxID=50990 RepID=A0A4Y7PNB2_9AGAM|nr:hypothetical protein BD410DRAFT_852307 [Rickenella mellea]
MKLILTGATGAAGLEILRAAMSDIAVERPASIRPSPKVQVFTHGDFASYPSTLLDRIRDHDACIWALGKSSNGMTERDYVVLTRDWPMAAIAAFNDSGMGSVQRPFRFVYVSGESADQSEKALLMFARVKGRADKDLIDFAKSTHGTMKAQMLKPGYFFPEHPDDRQDVRTAATRFFDRAIIPILTTIKPSMAIKIGDLAKAAVRIAKGECGDDEVFTNAQMKVLAQA